MSRTEQSTTNVPLSYEAADADEIKEAPEREANPQQGRGCDGDIALTRVNALDDAKTDLCAPAISVPEPTTVQASTAVPRRSHPSRSSPPHLRNRGLDGCSTPVLAVVSDVGEPCRDMGVRLGPLHDRAVLRSRRAISQS